MNRLLHSTAVAALVVLVLAGAGFVHVWYFKPVHIDWFYARTFAKFALEAAGKEMSTTVAFVRMVGQLLRDAALGKRIVPIIADEARTFGMADLFRQIGIYSPIGQLYQPEDQAQLSYYKEAVEGQILEEGINEAGALASWVAAATSYSTHGLAMLPMYIYYSIFGFQRVGDESWAAADSRSRGFLFGATAGRTTLSGEGLQHQDGTSHLVASTIPNCRATSIPSRRSSVKLVTEKTSAATFQSPSSSSAAAITSFRIVPAPSSRTFAPFVARMRCMPRRMPSAAPSGMEGCA